MTAPQAVITLGPPRASDRDRVIAMVEATGVFRSDEVAVALEVFDGAVENPGIDYDALCAFDGETLVGFTLFGPTPCTVATWDLYWIVVDPTVHRHGIGQQLMAAVEETVRSRDGRLLVVETSSRDDYRPTRRFYESLGYDRAATIPGYYAPGDDLVVFVKPLAREMAQHG
ncbi:MAG: GNAT family N-acetyltransferase [Gemmatimonadales bacterium]|jgi:ribosomal protein S18 acetylase RimI-like enzyme